MTTIETISRFEYERMALEAIPRIVRTEAQQCRLENARECLRALWQRRRCEQALEDAREGIYEGDADGPAG